MAKQVMPEAELQPRASDVELTNEQFGRIGLFAQLQRKPTLDKFPGALRLRRFRKGEVLFRQGEAGWTAFYILTSEDVLAVGQSQMASLVAAPQPQQPDVEPQGGTLQPQEIAALRKRLDQIAAPGAKAETLRAVATVYLAVPKPKEKKKAGWFGFGGGHGKTKAGEAVYIPVDGPVSISYDSMNDDLHEGEMFGEMSCLYRSPRSATVVAKRDCYMLEMLRNILDQLQKDPTYKAKADEIYRQRVLRLHLRNLSIFDDLTDQQFEELRKDVELASYEPGQLVCDENDRSDCMYIVRTGLVKSMKNVSSLLALEDVQNWPGFGDALAEGEQNAATPRGKFWQLLPTEIRTAVKAASDPFKTMRDERRNIVQAINEILKQPKLADAKEFQELLATPAVKDRAQDLPANKKDWTELDTRRYNRLLLEAIYPQMISRRARPVGPPMILSYRSRGEFIGEMGLMAHEPRSATCIAHGQPNDCGLVELVKISEQTFRKLINSSPAIKKKVEDEVAARKQASQERAKTPIWDDSRQVLLSRHFEELGLIQGQKLMLIDLDRCTRCDECVRGCVHTHDDGRSRLFLDGPRFGKYLVPTTCRSCLDPVCMIGCPVGSIHRGDNKQIVIEDWCIGCGLCSEQCPYGSIQMHDLGLIPEKARDWHFLPGAGVADPNWFGRGFNDAAWLTGRPPFLYGREMHAALNDLANRNRTQAAEQTLYFRYEFDVPAAVLKECDQFKMEVTSADPTAAVWVNGHELTTTEKPKRGKRDFWIPPKADEARQANARPYLHAGTNVVAVKVSPLWMVRIADARTGEEQFNLRGHEGAVRSLAIAPDGKRLAAGASDGTVRIWTLADAKEIANIKAHAGMVTAVAFTPDGRLVTTGEDKLAKLWTLDAKGAKEAASLKGHEKIITCAKVSPDGQRIATGSWDRTVRLWDAKTGNALAQWQQRGNVFDLSFSPDGRRLAIGADDGAVSLWDLETEAILKQFSGHQGLIWGVSYAPDGRRIISAGADGTVRVWDATGSGNELACMQGHHGAVRSVAFGPDARYAISGSEDRSVRIWDARAGKQTACIESQQGKVYAVAFSSDGQRVAFSAQSFTTGDVLLDLRFDKINKPEAAQSLAEELTEKLVTHRAVVCDLCSTLPGQVPACVNACPHDAAMRVDARSEFPVR